MAAPRQHLLRGGPRNGPPHPPTLGAPRGTRGAPRMTVARFAVRHRVPAARWPTAEEAARSRWFSPARIGRLEVAERTWVPAMVPWRATEDGVVTPEVLEWYEIGRAHV